VSVGCNKRSALRRKRSLLHAASAAYCAASSQAQPPSGRVGKSLPFRPRRRNALRLLRPTSLILRPYSSIKVNPGEVILGHSLIKFRVGSEGDYISIVAMMAPAHMPWVWCDAIVAYKDNSLPCSETYGTHTPNRFRNSWTKMTLHRAQPNRTDRNSVIALRTSPVIRRPTISAIANEARYRAITR
jgi:hypothetical protein